MLIKVVAVGRLKSGPERDLADRYRSRALAMARPLGFSGPDVVELPEARQRRAEDRQADEADRIRDRAGSSCLLILDEAAPSLSSEDFAWRLAGLRDAGRTSLALVIGGPDGLAPGLRTSAGWTLAFGRLTLPHQMVRVLVLEQLYRAFTIIAGHPYHRSGGGQE